MGSWTSDFEQFCEFCKKVTDHTSSNDNDDTGTHTFCNECEKENWSKEKQQAFEFKEKVYEIAFGDDAINRDFDESEVITKLDEFSENARSWEQIFENNQNIDPNPNVFQAYTEYRRLEKIIEAHADSKDVQGDCSCEINIEEFTWKVYPEGADDYTICLVCGGCCAGSEGYYS